MATKTGKPEPVLTEEISEKEKQSLHNLFVKLDLNNDGRIDMNDLVTAMTTMQLPQVPGHAKNFFEKYDKDSDGQINFDEFVMYVKEHEKELLSFFKNIDTNKDGYVDAGEIVASFKKAGVKIGKAEAEKLLKRMDKDGTLKIDWDEWRHYLILTPTDSIHDILHYWRHSSIIHLWETPAIHTKDTPVHCKESPRHIRHYWSDSIVVSGVASHCADS
ncbi:hypothetical protein Btru_058086 [Bulinus truncatus]|nr:hypothetical protein Btru_058086 [Bulinus truncatus]